MKISGGILRGLVSGILWFAVTPFAHAHSVAEMDRIASQAPHLEAFLRDPDLLRQYQTAVENYYGTKRFHCRTFKQVIDELRLITQKVPWIKDQIWKKWDEKNSLLVMAEKGETFAFRSVSRKLHTIWSYTSKDKCSDEVCENLFKQDKTGATVFLGRWSVVLSGSQVHLVERDGHYSGMAVLLAPYKKENQTFGLVDAFGDPKILSIKVPFRRTLREEAKLTSLLEIWTAKMLSVRPTWLAGYLMRNQQVREHVKQASFEHHRVEKLKANNYLPVDPASKLVAAHLAGKCSNSNLPINTLLPVSGKVGESLVQISPLNINLAQGEASLGSPDSALENFSKETIPNLGVPSSSGIVVAQNPSGSSLTGVAVPGKPNASELSYAKPSQVILPKLSNPSRFSRSNSALASTGDPKSLPLVSNGFQLPNVGSSAALGAQASAAPAFSGGSPSSGSGSLGRSPSSISDDLGAGGSGSPPNGQTLPPGAGPGTDPGNEPPPATPPTGEEPGTELEVERLKKEIDELVKNKGGKDAIKEKMKELVEAAADSDKKVRKDAREFLSKTHFSDGDASEAGIELIASEFGDDPEKMFMERFVSGLHEAALGQCENFK